MAEIRDTSQDFRLNQAIARAGLCSRRKADELIKAGRVSVNGEIAANPATRVRAADILAVDGKPVNLGAPLCYVILHKPPQVICTLKDPQKRQTIIDILPQKLRHLRLFPIGRLDYFSEGLLLLSNDGALAQRLAHPSYHQPKLYEALVRGPVLPEAIAAMRKGMTLRDGQKLLPARANAQTLSGGDTLITLELRQGLNRQIRRMCESLGLTILRLKRVAQGPIRLGELAPGKARELTAAEVARLRQAAGLAPQPDVEKNARPA